MGGIISVDDDATFNAEQVKELVGDKFNQEAFDQSADGGETITGAQLKAIYFSQLSDVVSVHPYFEIPDGRKDEFKAIWEAMLPTVQEEEGNRGYEFAFNGNVAYCRESYANAEGVLAHMVNVGDAIGKVLEFCALTAFEVCGSEAQLAKLREPMASLNPKFFVVDRGFRRAEESTQPSIVTIQPYFDIPEDRVADFKAAVEVILPTVNDEEGCQFYELAFHGNTAYFREGYGNGGAALVHLGNAGPMVQGFMEYCTLNRPIQVCGTEEELAQLREPMAALNPDFFVVEMGFRK